MLEASVKDRLQICKICPNLTIKVGKFTEILSTWNIFMFARLAKFCFQHGLIQAHVFLFYILTFWTLDVSQTASYKITLVRQSVCLSVRPSVRPSLSFLKIGSLVFSNIVHDDS